MSFSVFIEHCFCKNVHIENRVPKWCEGNIYGGPYDSGSIA